MSFDLYVWHEPEPITPAIAESRLRQGAFRPHPAVRAMRAALLDRFPPGSGTWSIVPPASDELLALSVAWPRAGEVGAAVVALAREHGLVCYEPQSGLLNPNAAGHLAAFTLTSAAGPEIPDPSSDRIDTLVGELGPDNHFVILERSDGWFVQVGYGPAAGTEPGRYALEYREGGPEHHFRTETTDPLEASRLLTGFLTGDDSWKRRYVWRPLFS
ncbi:hypothetical protein ACWT_6606 [Actinoplanes sp. SE50]|uniref:hypothetical protein n=1 Tax=unclassified Actinoplanes TaxID=2626549 RepID=UPI00023EC6D7|nr:MULTISPECIES: hypothetical protein [unclassified Actinoplanes]AEV87618.1 hypothetical protein ACPL_6736 [Actinoplanes sp. SE50/110]ATO86021.1 hypothetical protein ACWT_6606 [Actinoplanes sp. SE50]SLM03435.1 uncharacterized protein ACSP50_6724 [Actinoplanes sp. SE50/110]